MIGVVAFVAGIMVLVAALSGLVIGGASSGRRRPPRAQGETGGRCEMNVAAEDLIVEERRLCVFSVDHHTSPDCAAYGAFEDASRCPHTADERHHVRPIAVQDVDDVVTLAASDTWPETEPPLRHSELPLLLCVSSRSARRTTRFAATSLPGGGAQLLYDKRGKPVHLPFDARAELNRSRGQFGRWQ